MTGCGQGPAGRIAARVAVSLLIAAGAAGLSQGPAWAADAGTPTPGIPAFPGAEGFGAVSLGGRGGVVHTVTSLADSGPGSLRAAVEATGPRTVVFAVSGTIRLESPLRIRNGRITIAGQTAPGDGITLRDQPLVITADDVVIRYIRSRLGDESKVEADAVSIDRGHRIILDHVSASWSVDETLSVSNRSKTGTAELDLVTVQWSVIAESLTRSHHAKGAHGYGSLVRGSHGARYSFHHNLWAHHSARMPRPGNFAEDGDHVGLTADFRNNVFYDWGGKESGYNADKQAVSRYNFIANAYIPGPSSRGRMAFKERSAGAQSHFAENSMDGTVPADPWSLLDPAPAPANRLPSPVEAAPVTTDTAARAVERVLAHAGAANPRDAVDARIVAQVRDRTGRLIDSQREVGGWPDLTSTPAPTDRDGDGMPDAYETARGLNPADPADGAVDRDGDGYTHLEDYLNSLVPDRRRAETP